MRHLLPFIFAALAVADTQSGVVRSGTQVIPGATVVADCGSGRISTVTDEAGRFELGGLPAADCRFSVAIFGFEPARQQAKPTETPLTFELQLQRRATLPASPDAPQEANRRGGPGRGGFNRGDFPGRGGFPGGGRGGFPPGGVPGGGRGGAATGGPAAAGPGRGPNPQYQNLSLVENTDEPGQTADTAPGASFSADDASGANEAFLVNGSLSQGVEARPTDGFGLGGPGGFFGPGGPGDGFGPGGPGGPGGANPFGGGPGGDVAAAPGGGGPGGGGPGGFGGGGFGGGGRGGGGFGGGGRGGGRGGPPPDRNRQFGNRISRGRGRQFQGSVFYTVGNSVLNARPYSFTSPTSLTGQELPKAAYAANRFGFSGGGPLSIPHIISGDKTFWFVNYTGNRSKNGYDQVGNVPTAAQRKGDFSGLATTIYSPFTNTPFPGNIIPDSLIQPNKAIALLGYFPLPNAQSPRYNYQHIGANPSNNDNLQTRINQTLTTKDRLNVNLNYQHRDSQNTTTFGFVDPSHGYGLSLGLSYSRNISRSLINTLGWNFSRNVSQSLSSFSNGADIETPLGITGVTTDPAAYGPPTITFTNFASLSDATPSLTRAQTSALSEALIQIRGKQTITYGAGFQRRQNNSIADANARGTFNFTGLATGYDLADFLLSRPQSTSVVRYTDNSRYLRETTLSAFVTDDYRVKAGLTINAGLRWEYFGPFTEKNDHIANLSYVPGATTLGIVLAGQSAPDGLVQPDYALFSPRVGIAWRPSRNREIVVRGGYGLYYNGGVYSTIANRLINQPPFAQTSTQQTVATAPLTLQNGFPVIASQPISNTFAVDPNYKPGYAQTWTASIQRTYGRAYVVELIYNGSKGSNLDVMQLPNRAPAGDPLTAQQRLIFPNASEFTYDSAVGSSIYNSGQLRFSRRFARSASFQALYTYSKAIDDSSTLGGGPVYIPGSVSAERALSPTDQRHALRLNYTVQSPVKNTQTGKWATLARGWTLGGGLNATSGTPFTATVTGDPSGTAYTGNSRAQATGLPVTGGSGYFNTLAFAVPLTGTFGNAGRDTIPGLAQFSLNASFFRSFRIDDKRRIEFRIDSSNPINHVNVTGINTTVNSQQYGLPTAAGGMRSMTATVRLRF